MIEAQQNSLQRGFTKHSSPMNCSLIVEETIREYKDLRKPVYIEFLGAKSAFDVVSHDSLLRKLFHAGVEGVSWSLVHSLHAETESVVKWNGAYSEVFKVEQGVRQGSLAPIYTSFMATVYLPGSKYLVSDVTLARSLALRPLVQMMWRFWRK